MRHYDAANRLARTRITFDRGQFGASVNRLIANFTAEFFAEHAELGSLSETPVLILGMPLGKLQVLNGPIAGKELELTKALITLGKPGTQVAVISRRPQGYFLTHIEGDGKHDNYPVVNDAPIGPQAYAIQNGDIIELAGIKMEFNLIK